MKAKKYRIGELCRMVKGTSPTLKTEPGPYPLVVTAGYRRNADSWQLEGPAVCIPLVSSTGHGDAALHRVHYQEGKFALANLLVALLPNAPSVCDVKYLYYLLMTQKDELLVPLMQGTANVSLKEQDIAGVEILLPPLAEQRRIVARIEELAAQIHEARTLRGESEEEGQLLLDSIKREMFLDPAKQKWLLPLSNADLKLNRESRDPSRGNKESFTYIDIAAVGKGTKVLVQGKKLAKEDAPSRARRVIHENDILISTVRPNLRAFTKVGRALDDEICSTGFAVLTCGPSILPDFLLHQCCSPFFVDQCIARSTGGHYPAINDANLRQINIISPPLAEQRRIVAELDALQAEVDALKRLQAETAAELDALLPAILDKAFKGEL